MSCFQDLGLTSSATPAEVRNAYRLLARRLHPDKHPNASPAEKSSLEEEFKRVTASYQTALKKIENGTANDAPAQPRPSGGGGQSQAAGAPEYRPPPDGYAPAGVGRRNQQQWERAAEEREAAAKRKKELDKAFFPEPGPGLGSHWAKPSEVSTAWVREVARKAREEAAKRAAEGDLEASDEEEDLAEVHVMMSPDKVAEAIKQAQAATLEDEGEVWRIKPKAPAAPAPAAKAAEVVPESPPPKKGCSCSIT
mmetsp:Transcript_109747/g.251644  ORF Transcript_109747/g.251644 Transcript_109747/m.251644 type:complete len:252 (+) Transcript_109747:18-773(+)